MSKEFEKTLSRRARIKYRRDMKIHRRICELEGEILLSKRLTDLLGPWGNTLRHLIGEKVDAEVVQKAYGKTKIFERVAEGDYEKSI